MPTSSSTEAARRSAQEILGERRFHPPAVPRPLHGVLHAVGQALSPLRRALDDLVAGLASVLPGGRATVWALLAALVLLAGALIAVRGARRALGEGRDSRLASSGAPALSAAELDRRATAAEQQGKLEEAVRLRFQAGLVRLAQRELIASRPSMSNAEVARALRSDRFDRLRRRFDEIVYGGHAAAREDVEAARRDWPLVLGAQGEA
jgi:hypothetical protein